jgi:hypothetical protein
VRHPIRDRRRNSWRSGRKGGNSCSDVTDVALDYLLDLGNHGGHLVDSLTRAVDLFRHLPEFGRAGTPRQRGKSLARLDQVLCGLACERQREQLHDSAELSYQVRD